MNEITPTDFYVIDDDQLILTVVDGMLRDHGFNQITLLQNCPQALSVFQDILETQKEDDKRRIVFIDALIGDAKGGELCSEIKRNLPDTYVIMMLDTHIEMMMSRADQKELETIADDFLFKPFTGAEFGMRLNLAFQQPALPAEDTTHPHTTNDEMGLEPELLLEPGDEWGDLVIVGPLRFSKYTLSYWVRDKKDLNSLCELIILTNFALQESDCIDEFNHCLERRSQIECEQCSVIRDTGMYGDYPFVVLDHVEGIGLKDRLTQRNLPSIKQVVNVATGLAKGLKKIMETGLEHEILRIEDVALMENGDVTLRDFWLTSVLARKFNPEHEIVAGMPLYCPPEQLRSGMFDGNADIFAYAAVLYHFSIGFPAFLSARDVEGSLKVLETPPKDIHKLRPGFPKKLETVILSCLSPSPEKRPKNFDEILDVLSSVEKEMAKFPLSSFSGKRVILLVDDEENVLKSVSRCLKKTAYVVHMAKSGREALELMEKTAVDLLITDYRMPAMNGVELLSVVRDRWPQTIRMILSGFTDMKTMMEAINQGHVFQFIEKPCQGEQLCAFIDHAFEKSELTALNTQLSETVREQNAELQQFNLELEARVDKRTQELLVANSHLEAIFNGVVQALGGMMDLLQHELDLKGHGLRVANLSCRLRSVLGNTVDIDLNELEIAAFLHDMGKINFPLGFSSYTKEEQSLFMRRHPTIGANILADIPSFENIASMIKHHHENMDGTGYPAELTGEDIPIGARIIAVADAYDRIAKPFGQGPERKPEKVLDMLWSKCGNILDENLTTIFIEKVFPEVSSMDKQTLQLNQLQTQMKLAEDIQTENGEVVMKAGTVLTSTLINDLTSNESLDPFKTRVQIVKKTDERIKAKIGSMIDNRLYMLHQYPDNKIGTLKAKQPLVKDKSMSLN